MLPSLKIVNIVSVPFFFFCQRLYPIFNNYAAPRDFGASLVYFSLWWNTPMTTIWEVFLGLNKSRLDSHHRYIGYELRYPLTHEMRVRQCFRRFFSFNLANARFPLHSVLFSIHCYIINASIWFLQSI